MIIVLNLMLCLFRGNQIPEIHFPHFFHVWQPSGKLVKGKFFSGKKKKLPFITGKCFPFLVKRKTLSYLYIKHISETLCQIPLSLCLFPKTEARRTRIISLDTLYFRYFFPLNFSISLYYFLYMFLSFLFIDL